MKTMYDRDIDLLEVMDEGHKTIGKEVSDALTLFFTERDNELVGFSLEAASENLNALELVPYDLRLAAIVRLVRGVLGITQQELADKLDVNIRTIQRFESGAESNATFDNLIGIVDAAPDDMDISVLLRKRKTA